MIIGIDASRAINESAGIARYSQNLLAALAKIDQKNKYKLLFTFVNNRRNKIKLAKNIANKFYLHQERIIPLPGQIKEMLWGFNIPILKLIIGSCDIWHALSFFEASIGDKFPQIVTIYDMSTFLYPEQRGEEISKRLSKRSIEVMKKARKIIAISQSTKKDILKFLPNIPAQKIKVIPLAINDIFIKDRSIKKKNTILFVGTVEPRKNLKNLIIAYKKLPVEIKNKYKLLIVGANGWNNSNIYQEAQEEVGRNRIVFKNHVSNRELVKLYNQAKIFIYPSVYEGFGLPVLEAMSCGTPVITSCTSSLPEVAGQAAIYIDPNSVQDITNNIQKLLGDEKLQEKLSIMGIKQAQKFSWKKCAQETLNVYKEVYAKK